MNWEYSILFSSRAGSKISDMVWYLPSGDLIDLKGRSGDGYINVVNAMNHIGKDGWELCGDVDNGDTSHWSFKREVT